MALFCYRGNVGVVFKVTLNKTSLHDGRLIFDYGFITSVLLWDEENLGFNLVQPVDIYIFTILEKDLRGLYEQQRRLTHADLA